MLRSREKSTEVILEMSTFYTLSPNSDKHLISPDNITAQSLNIQVMRIKELITKYNVSSFLITFSQLVS